MTPDNFAVDESTNQVKVIDLEDFIVVDKEVLIKSKLFWEKLHSFILRIHYIYLI